MRKSVLVGMVVLLAVIVPQMTSAAPVAQSYTLSPYRLVEFDRISCSGDWGWLGGGNTVKLLADKVRQAAVATGRLGIAVSGSQFDEIAASQDRIQDSGRYRNSSRQLVRRGQMIAPSEHFNASFVSTMSRKDEQVMATLGRWISRSSANIQSTKLSARVEIVLSSTDIETGIIGTKPNDAITAVGEASQRDVSGSGYVRGQNIDYRSQSSSIEAKLYLVAFNRAVENLVAQLTPAAGRPIPITVHSGKTVHLGDEVVFYRGSQKIARYEILTINGSNLGIRPLLERSRPGSGDKFDIVAR